MTAGAPPPPLLCHAGAPALRRAWRAVCPRCGSFWDVEACGRGFAYTDDYPTERQHHDTRIGDDKVRSLARWLSELGLDLRGHVVCEVGFGGGFCLAHVGAVARRAFGVEAVAANLANARRLGVPASELWRIDEAPERLPVPVSFWLFQDSFEHILDVERFMRWLTANSADAALLLVVAPDAMSVSRQVMGRFWLHRLADHLFHWSAAGLVDFLERHGFALLRRFRPVKWVSAEVVWNHMARTRFRRPAALAERLAPPFTLRGNIGEMGLLLGRALR